MWPASQRSKRENLPHLTYLSLPLCTMSSNWSEKHEQVIEKCLESEETFRTYLTSTEHPGNVRRAFLAFTGLVNLFSESINEREELEKKVKEHQEARMRMEGALTYVEDQLATLRAAPIAPAAPAPAPVAPTPPIVATPPIVYPTLPINTPVPATAPTSMAPGSPTPSETEPSNRSHVARVIKIPDPDRFYADKAKDEITYEDWHLQMLSKMSINASTMPSEKAKHNYVQSCVGGHALAQLKLRLRPSAANLFWTSDEMFEILTAAFGNANQKQEDCAAYRLLNQGTRDFSSFWAEFQRLAQDLDLSEEMKISDLIQKLHHSIQHKLATGEEEPTNLVQLARRCQRIEQTLKEANRSKLVQDRIAEQNAT